MVRRLCVSALVFVLTVIPVGPAAAAAQDMQLVSKSAVLMDALSGEVLYQHNPHEGLPPASVTKLMTLFLVYEALEKGAISLEDEVRTSSYAASLGGAQIWLEPGEVMPLEELIKAVAVRSANDASVALAEHVAGTHEQFVTLMNQKAQELGMENTQFKNAHGLYDPEHYMSAYDVALLSRYLVLNYPQLLAYTGRWEDRIRVGTSDEQWLVNTNKLIKRYDGVDGLKTGWTGPESGYCVSATARRGATRLIAVIMGGPDSNTRFEEAAKLLSYGFANFEAVKVADKNSVIGEVMVDEGQRTTVQAVLPQTLGVTVRKGEASKLEKVVVLDDFVRAPVRRRQKVGELIVKLGDDVVAQSDVVTAGPVARASFLQLMFRSFWRVWPTP